MQFVCYPKRPSAQAWSHFNLPTCSGVFCLLPTFAAPFYRFHYNMHVTTSPSTQLPFLQRAHHAYAALFTFSPPFLLSFSLNPAPLLGSPRSQLAVVLTVLSLNLMHIILANDVYSGDQASIKTAMECHSGHLRCGYVASRHIATHWQLQRHIY